MQPITANADVMIQRLEVEADEKASFMEKKANKQWIRLAMDINTRHSVSITVFQLIH